MDELDIWDPFEKLRRIEGRMRRLIEFPEVEFKGFREPLIDIVDKGNELRVVAELPGVEKKEIELDVNDQIISIKAKSSFETKESKEKEGYFYHERGTSSFFRSIPLPVQILPEKAVAEFKNSILTISLPKKFTAAKPKGRKIEVR